VVFGYLIEAAELLAGVVLVLGPLVWLFAWDRISDRLHATILILTTLAALGDVPVCGHPVPAGVGEEPEAALPFCGRASYDTHERLPATSGSVMPASVNCPMSAGLPWRRWNA
jgi:hypothetical protein